MMFLRATIWLVDAAEPATVICEEARVDADREPSATVFEQ